MNSNLSQSGLLMSVIRALSASETNEQREVEKAKLEKEYKRSDQKLDELVSLHEHDLTQVMQVRWNSSFELFPSPFSLFFIADIQQPVGASYSVEGKNSRRQRESQRLQTTSEMQKGGTNEIVARGNRAQTPSSAAGWNVS